MNVRLLLLSVLLCWPEAQTAQSPVPAVSTQPAAVVSFTFDWAEADVPHWSVQLGEGPGGSLIGRYDQLDAGATPSAASMRRITVTSASAERVRGGFKTVVIGNCETKTKHLAQTGKKSIAYARPGSDVWPSCTFNYSDDKALMDAVAAFQAIAETMRMGEKLEHTHRFDRLGLDAQIAFLSEEVAAGRAIEIQNIATVLNSIVNDERVIERARRKAARLLQDASPPPVSPSETSPR